MPPSSTTLDSYEHDVWYTATIHVHLHYVYSMCNPDQSHVACHHIMLSEQVLESWKLRNMYSM